MIEVTSAIRCADRTGAEMEALSAVAAACLTIYDMAKAVEKGMVIGEIKLLEKRGGKRERGLAEIKVPSGEEEPLDPSLNPSPMRRGKLN